MSIKKSLLPDKPKGGRKRKAAPKKTISRWKIALFILSTGLSLIFIMGAVGVFLVMKHSQNLPDISVMKNYRPSLITTLYDRNEKVVAEYFIEKRILRKIENIPNKMIQATLAIEDDNFFKHSGIDFQGVARAAIVNLKSGKVVQGGSTITQQVAKILFLTRERTFERKLKEVILSLRIEQEFSKEEILEIYLNEIYYGHGVYGVEAASQLYFGKSVTGLTTGEMAILAGLPKSPNNFSPFSNMRKAVRRRALVVNRMLETGYITKTEATLAKSEPVRLAPFKKVLNHAPFFAEHVRRYLEKNYGSTSLYREGLKIYTTLDLKWQQAARKAIKKGLEKTDRRLGYRGPKAWIDPKQTNIDWDSINPPQKTMSDRKYFAIGRRLKGIVREVTPDRIDIEVNGRQGVIEQDGFAWAHPVDAKKDGRFFGKVKDATTLLKPGDVIEVKILETPVGAPALMELDQYPAIQGAIVGIEYATGAIRSMVGGYDYSKSSFNRAVQAYRQPGSAFKPIIYASALDKGHTPASVIIDSPIIFEDDIGEFKNWKPMNFKQKFYGPTTLRSALVHSRNIVTVKILQKIGLPYAVKYAHKMGITSKLDPNLSLALGSSSVNLMEMISAYGSFANGGLHNKPFFISRIEDSRGRIIEEHGDPVPERVVEEDTAFLITNILHGVVQEGTGRGVKSVGVPAAGKTGTTNDFFDAWFIGYTRGIATGVWVGKDREEILGRNETGSRAAAPIWLEYMKEVVKDQPIDDFVPPNNVVFVRIDKKTGYLATPDNPNSFFEAFKEGTEPTTYGPEPVS